MIPTQTLNAVAKAVNERRVRERFVYRRVPLVAELFPVFRSHLLVVLRQLKRLREVGCGRGGMRLFPAIQV
jgi:hypothetical protein